MSSQKAVLDALIDYPHEPGNSHDFDAILSSLLDRSSQQAFLVWALFLVKR